MVYRHTIDATSYVFDDLGDLLAKATPPRSGDVLAGVAATSAAENVAAKMALADVPLKQFLNEAVVPYEEDDVTRLIVDTHDADTPLRLCYTGPAPERERRRVRPEGARAAGGSAASRVTGGSAVDAWPTPNRALPG